MSVSGALDTNSETDVISSFAKLFAGLSLAVFADVIGASGGQIAILPGTSSEIVLDNYLLIILGVSLAVGYIYNGQAIDELEAADGILGIVGLAAPLAWFYVPQVQEAIPSEFEMWAQIASVILGLIGIHIFLTGDDGGILG
jgi:hypothetical protein